ncbi:MAG: sodium-translocating pyrophosphatase [Opitutales bacterium]|jgi:K(+)-stimulated pyrophosphate-energized sodium pump
MIELLSMPLVASILVLAFAYFFYHRTLLENPGNERMQTIAGHVTAGAKAYLNQQYKIVAIVFVAMTVLFAILAFGLGLQDPWAPLAFVTGGFVSGLAGYFGMRTATAAASRTAQAASESLDRGLRVAFRSGAVMGLSVVGLGLLAITVWFLGLSTVVEDLGQKTGILLSFGMGASLQALFARVGGGIYTKAADVGADLVGKVEAGMPEDDPRNPATIADNVGDFVGDVAGMGADLFESYCGSIIATAALGVAAFAGAEAGMQLKAAMAPLLVAGLGALLSVVGVFLVRLKPGETQAGLLKALDRGINSASFLVVLAALAVVYFLGFENYLGLWGAIVIGLLTGIVIGKSTEHYTSAEHAPTQMVAKSAQTGPATVIIAGIGNGKISTVIPVVAVMVGIVGAFAMAAGGLGMDKLPMGLYGIGFAAVGMLSTLGVTLATDAYGPIADNAGGNAEMSGLGPEVRQRTDALDSLGNTTAAIGKGFAIGSAALTALALLASYVSKLQQTLVANGTSIELSSGASIPAGEATLVQMIDSFQLNLVNPLVLVGLFTGSMMAFLFCGLTMNAVGRAAQAMVNEVRRQFSSNPGIVAGTVDPDYALCVEISTRGAQREMLVPSLIAVLVPVVIGILFGPAGVVGLLAGALGTGFVLAIYMANAGGSWDNAKKFIEEGNFGGKGSDAHKAGVIGDTVGDPFKDTSGPSLNILIKLMTMVSIAVAGVTISFQIL